MSSIITHGYDIKFAYHIVRLLNEVEQILHEHDIDLFRNRQQLKSIRNGEWTEEQIIDYFHSKEILLEKLFQKSTLQNEPNEQKIKELLLKCLEEHFGSITKAIRVKVDINRDLDTIEKSINNLRCIC